MLFVDKKYYGLYTYSISIQRSLKMKKPITLSVKTEVNDKLNDLVQKTGFNRSTIVSLLIEKLADGKIELV